MDSYCDRCGALAKTKFILSNGNDLVFCGHHAREYQPHLDGAEEVILFDDTPTLVEV